MRSIITLIVLGCLVAFIVRGECTLRTNAQTFDEAVHLVAGYSYWKTGDFRINRETPPLAKLLWASPLLFKDVPFEPDSAQWNRNDIWSLGDEFLYESEAAHEELLRPARRMNVALGAIFVLLIGWVAYRWWGRWAGLTALALAAFDPNIAAQSAVLSTDIALALFCLATWYALWEYVQAPSQRKFIAAGACIGCALACKFSAGFAVVGVLVGVSYWLLRSGRFALPRVASANRWSAALSALVRLGLFSVAAILPWYFVIQAPDWARGLKQQFVRNDFADVRYYFNGSIDEHGWLAYFPVALALKTPITTLALAVVGCLPFGVKRFQRVDTAFLLLPPIVFLLGMMVMGVNIGVRIVLPFYPLLLLLAARCVTQRRHWLWQGITVAAIAYTPLADRRHLQEPISYFNEVVGCDQGHRYLGDSNLDWGQGLYALRTFLKPHDSPTIYLAYAGTARPEAYGIHYKRLPSWGQFQPPPLRRIDRRGRVFVAISVTNLQGIYLPNPNLYAWLRDRSPLTMLDGSIWVWDITDDEESIQRCDRLANVPW